MTKAIPIFAAFFLFAALTPGAESSSDLWARYQGELRVNSQSSLTLFKMGELAFNQRNFQLAATQFKAALDGDQQPKWTEVWSHVSLGKIFDITGQRRRAVDEYMLAQKTNDNTRGALDEASTYLQVPYPRP